MPSNYLKKKYKFKPGPNKKRTEPLKCEDCSYQTTRKHNMTKHREGNRCKRKQMRVQSLKCPNCGFKAINCRYLASHFKSCVPLDADKLMEEVIKKREEINKGVHQNDYEIVSSSSNDHEDEEGVHQNEEDDEVGSEAEAEASDHLNEQEFEGENSVPNVNPNSGGQKNGGQPLAPSDNYGNSDDDEDGQYDDIESPHTEDMQMTSSGVGQFHNLKEDDLVLKIKSAKSKRKRKLEDEHLQQGPSSSHQMIPPLQDPPARTKDRKQKKPQKKPQSIRQFIPQDIQELQGSRPKKPKKKYETCGGMRIIKLHEQLNRLCRFSQAQPPSMQTRNAEDVDNKELIQTYTQECCSALIIRNAAKLDGWHNPIEPSIMSLSGFDFLSGVFGAESATVNARHYTQELKEYVDSMTMDAFLSSFKQKKQKQPSLNVIDFDLKGSLTMKEFRPPSFLKDISLSAKCQTFLPIEYQSGKCENFGIISQADTFTNWHVDFSGTSVFYKMLKGKKEFYILQRCEKNLDALKDFDLKKTTFNRSDLYFPDSYNIEGEVQKITLLEGNALLLRSGIVHAVRTLEHSFALGINFIENRDLLQVSKEFTDERLNGTPLDSCYPYLGAVVYIEAIKELNEADFNPRESELKEIVSRVLLGSGIDGSLKDEILSDTKTIEQSLKHHFSKAHFDIPFKSLDDIKNILLIRS